MKPFLIKLFIFSIGLFLLYPIKTIYLLKNERYKKLVLGKEIYLSQEKSKSRNKNVKTLIIGDSVGHQLFKNDEFNDTLYSLACNQAISMAGCYFLLEDFLKLNPEVKKVVFIYAPRTFKNNLDQQYTFQYFLKPFYNDEYKPRFSSVMTGQIKKVPFYYLSQFPPILTSNWTPDWDFSKEIDGYYMSPISNDFLKRIIHLCKERSVKFIIMPTPSRISLHPLITDLQNSIHFPDYDFNDYFSRIDYIPDSCFLDDVHLKEADKYRAPYLSVIDSL